MNHLYWKSKNPSVSSSLSNYVKFILHSIDFNYSVNQGIAKFFYYTVSINILRKCVRNEGTTYVKQSYIEYINNSMCNKVVHLQLVFFIFFWNLKIVCEIKKKKSSQNLHDVTKIFKDCYQRLRWFYFYFYYYSLVPIIFRYFY